MVSDTLKLLFSSFAPQLPIYLLWVVGIVIALMRYKQNPRSMLLVSIAFGIFLISAIVLTGLTVGAIVGQVNNNTSANQIEVQIGLINVARIGVDIVGWGLLLVALFRTPVADRAETS